MPTTRGPLPAAVYWRRRALVVGIALALVFIGVNAVRGGGDDSSKDDSAVQVSGQPGDSDATPKKQRKKRKNAGQNGTGSQGETPLPSSDYTVPPANQPTTPPVPPEPQGECADSDIVITPSVPGAVARRSATIRLTLQTKESEACTWGLGSDSLAVKIVAVGGGDETSGISGDDGEVWASRECPRMVPNAEVVVRRDFPATYDLTWNARRSMPECPADEPWVEPGEYTVQAAAYGAEPTDPVTFSLADPDDVAVPDGPLGPDVPAPTLTLGKKGNRT
ncbi:hypothetical protein [Nocardioides sp. GXZ039]|uniref:hypothetical protein n=1 Tax=Nocardioides sp. GXZ039 TaxID=3136018 RepID=UPI0030F439FB